MEGPPRSIVVVQHRPTEAGQFAEFTCSELPGWFVQLELDSTGTVTSLRLEPSHELPPGGITSRLLRRVPVGALLSALRTDLTRMYRADLHTLRLARDSFVHDGEDPWPEGFGVDLITLSELARIARSSKSMAEAVGAFGQRPGRRGRPDVEYARLAALYVALHEEGNPAPVEALAESLHLSPAQVRNLLYEARRRNLRTKSAPGRAGGTLTDPALRLLEDNRGEH
jgi:hypothetical protein